HALKTRPETNGVQGSETPARRKTYANDFRESANSAFALEVAEQEQAAEDRVVAVPGLDLDGNARVAGDLPRQIVDTAGEGGGRLDEAQGREQLALQAAERPGNAPPKALETGSLGQAHAIALDACRDARRRKGGRGD